MSEYASSQGQAADQAELKAWPAVAVYCDGGVIGASRSRYGGSWAWCQVGHGGERGLRASGLILPTSTWPTITNNYTEFVAGVRALESLPAGWTGDFCTDSKITLGRLLHGYATEGLPDKLVERGLKAVARLGLLSPVLLDGHPTKPQLLAGTGKRGNRVSEHNVWCDTECSRIMAEYMMGQMKAGGYDG